MIQIFKQCVFALNTKKFAIFIGEAQTLLCAYNARTTLKKSKRYKKVLIPIMYHLIFNLRH